MSEHARPIPLEELLVHAGWVKGLARSLILDPARVDDVVQQTWMVAMERRPREVSQLRAWLGGIVRNLARNEQRGVRRRSAREERAASPEGLPSTLDVVERAELQRRVVDAVMALDEPYRSTVLLRWFDGLSAAEIARQLGIPDATVRTRCKRALERLRERLDAGAGGERRAWSLALLPLALPPAVPAAAAPLTGTLAGATLMGLGMKLTMGVLALLLVAGGTWWLLDDEALPPGPGLAVGTGTPAPAVAVVEPPEVLPATESLAPAPEPPATPRALVAAAGARAAEDPAPEPTPPFTIVGRVVAPDGRPVVGARVAHRPRWQRVEQPSLQMVQAGKKPVPPPLSWVTTDAQGAFEIEATPAAVEEGETAVGADMLFVRDEAFELTGRTVELPEGIARHEVGELVLQPAGVVTGRVVDERGLPLEGVRLQSPTSNLFGPFDRFEELMAVQPHWTVTTGADGRFTLGSLWPVRQNFYVVLDGYSSERLDLEPVVGREQDLGDIVLLGDRFLAGVVQDADGLGLEGIEVVGRPSKYMKLSTFQGEDSAQLQLNVRTSAPGAEVRAVTDASGAFRLGGLAEGTYAVAAGGAGWEAVSVREVPVNADDLVIELRPLATLFVRVLDEAGGRVSGATGSAWRMSGTDAGPFEAWLLVLDGEEASRAAAAAGIEEPEDLLVVRGAGRLGTRMEVSAPGHAPRRVDLPGVDAPESLLTEVRLMPGAQLSGRVTDAVGQPVATAAVTAQRLSDASGAAVRSRSSGEASLEARDTVTDEAGAYRFDTLQAGRWQISASAAGRGAVSARDVELGEGEHREGQDFQLEQAASLRGVALQADGTPWNGTVNLRGEALGQRPSRRFGLLQSTARAGSDQVRTGDDGRFLFEDLPAGDFVLSVGSAEPLRVSLAAGDEREVELVLPQPLLITGRVTDANGPVVGAEVRVFTGHGTALQRAGFLLMELRTDADGWYRASPAPRADCTLLVEHDTAWTEPVELSADRGTNARVNFHFGELRSEGVVLDAASGQPVAGATVEVVNQRLAQAYAEKETRGRADALFATRVVTDDAGRFALGRLLPGPHGIAVTAEGFADFVSDSIDVRADAQAAPLEIRLER